VCLPVRFYGGFFITFVTSLMRRWFNIRGLKILNKVMGIIIMILVIVGLITGLFLIDK
jgi:small neutral amino acid transporter SnatA (MarC family)